MLGNTKTICTAALVASAAGIAEGHGYISSPLPRQYRSTPVAVRGMQTNWVGITVPGDGSYIEGQGNAPNLNAGIGGGVAGAERELSIGHGLCGDLGDRKGFSEGPYGRTESRATVQSGGVLNVDIKVTAYHAGWFEFRLCNPDSSGALTQACLNEHVLEIDESTPYYPAVLDYAGMKGISKEGNGGWYKCKENSGFTDPTSQTPNTVWPKGSCCNDGGACSDPMANKDRYVLENASGGGPRNYQVNLKVPEDTQCNNCVLQWMYQTANSRDSYPETFWNCADVSVTANSNPGAPTPKPTPRPTPQPTNGASPTPKPTVGGGGGNNPECGSCSGCWWTATSPAVGCYQWAKGTCDAQGSAYMWCDGSSSSTSSTQPTPKPTNGASPTPQPTNGVSPTPRPTTTGAPPSSPPTFPPSPTIANTANSAGWERVMSPEIIAKGHPWGISNYGPSGLSGLAAATVIYQDIKTALEEGPTVFSSFCNSGDAATDKREAAAFLANVLKETGGYSAFVEVSPAGTYCTWNGEGGAGMQESGRDYPCGPSWASQGYANEFIGRGAIQLTWNINYGKFSDFMFGDKNILLKNPEMVEGTGPLGWAASLWFWMTPQDFGGSCPPKQFDSFLPVSVESCHQAMSQTAGGGMGQTIRIINGGYEACPTSSYRISAVQRMNYFLSLTSLLNVPAASGPNCQVNSQDMSPTACDVSGMSHFSQTEGTIGNPLIGQHPSSECPKCAPLSCSSSVKSKWLGVPDDPVQKVEWICA
jgi:predicted carbohydrate-binding protein with CBM5 and CBM33 domain